MSLTVWFPAMVQAELEQDDPITASVIFYSQSYAIERIQKWCAKVHPPSADAIQAARDQWDKAHRTFWNVVPDLLRSQLSKDERMSIAVQARLDNDKIEAKLAESSQAEQIRWCGDAPTKITSPRMSLMNRSDLLRAITTYQAE
jgi:hypothetical protein